jgi:paraquat-inducible protein B
MNSSNNMAVIGAFVVGAVVLAVVALLVLGGGEFLSTKSMAVMYFEGSLKGLSIGSPVVFRGIKVGVVDRIAIRANPEEWTVEIPVYVKLDAKSWGVENPRRYDASQVIRQAVELGLRAKLDTQSFVTGQMQVTLDFLPEEEAVFVGENPRCPEIPTVPSSIEKLTQTLKDLPLKDISDDLSSAISSINDLIDNPELDETVHNIKEISVDAREFVARLDKDVLEPLANAVRQTDKMVTTVNEHIGPLLEEVHETVQDTEELVEHVDDSVVDRVAESVDSAKAALEEVRSATETLEKLLANVESMTRQNAEERERANKLLKELSEAAQALRNAADYLGRHPEALIRGKGNPN